MKIPQWQVNKPPSSAFPNNNQLIHTTIGNFNIDPDKKAVERINESLSTLQQARELRVREAESALKSKHLSG
jgi:hypothetical protein